MIKNNVEIACTGYSIAGDWYTNESADKSLLLLLGYQSKKERQVDFASRIALKGVNVLVIDYSGHGVSPFELSETKPAQHLSETVSAFDWLQNTIPEGQALAVMGTSYGAFQAANLSLYRDFSKLLLRTPAIYRPEDMYTTSTLIDREETQEVYRRDASAVGRHPLFNHPSLYSGQTLVVVHSKDEDIPPETSDAYIRSFAAEVYIAEGFRHWSRDPQNPAGMLDTHQEAIANWLAK